MKSAVSSVVLAWAGLVTLIVETVGYSREVTLDQWEPWSPTCREAENELPPVQCPQLSVTLPILDQDVVMKLCDWDSIKKNPLSAKLVTQCTQLFTYVGPVKVYIACTPTKRPRGRLLQTVKPPELVE